MKISDRKFATRRKRVGLAATLVAAAVALSGCAAVQAASGTPVKMELISANTTNPYFVTLAQAAAAEAKKDGVDLKETAATSNGDTASQINEVQSAVASGVKVIIITANGSAVNPAIEAARKAGVLVLGVDAVPDPPSTVDMTFATDNRAAGKADGAWVAKKLNGKPAVIAMLDAFTDNSLLVDINRDQGFLTGMGVPLNNPNLNNDEGATGNYSGGTYTIACHGASKGAVDDGRTAMENCLSKNPNINVVYAINEPAAEGAYAALKAANRQDETIIASIDGSCDGVGQVKTGVISTLAVQYPRKMAQQAVDSGLKWAKSGEKPAASTGLKFHDTGVDIVTNSTIAGTQSLTPEQGTKVCW